MSAKLRSILMAIDAIKLQLEALKRSVQELQVEEDKNIDIED